ncbi:hypothetical protein [Roseisolibacter agri]|uniref:Uncharacterized protein n=1 Tax=Roseisolibacter agri TaxID=2014610 RepID=A0AA37QBE1_9BACT|nr:hypothetical protein [Roseisolibacter agri]GLC28222.1 hypothetical protein rosag_47350 [Roseisolibacter agri]
MSKSVVPASSASVPAPAVPTAAAPLEGAASPAREAVPVVPDYQLSVIAQPPGPEHTFHSREEEITDYFCGEDAYRDATQHVARTWSVWHGADLLGCFAIQTDAVRLDGRERPESIPYLWAPAVKIARFGVNEAVARRKIQLTDARRADDPDEPDVVSVGEYMLLYVIGLAKTLSEQIAVRYLTLDALPREGLLTWYENYGFERTNVPVIDYDGATQAAEVNMLFDLHG